MPHIFYYIFSITIIKLSNCFVIERIGVFSYSGNLVCNNTAVPNSNVTFINNDTCVNWNYYYTECKGQGNNPFQGTISFDNIGLAWVAIFLVSAPVTRPLSYIRTDTNNSHIHMYTHICTCTRVRMLICVYVCRMEYFSHLSNVLLLSSKIGRCGSHTLIYDREKLFSWQYCGQIVFHSIRYYHEWIMC